MTQPTDKIVGTDQAWEDGTLGTDERYVAISQQPSGTDTDDALSLQMISIRLHKGMIDKLKTIGERNGLGYQLLIRQALTSFVDSEMEKIASAAQANQGKHAATQLKENNDNSNDQKIKTQHYSIIVQSELQHQIKSIKSFIQIRDDILMNYTNEYLLFKDRNSKLATANQAHSIAILHLMASLVDAFFIYFALKLGAKIENIRRVQYRQIGNSELLEIMKKIIKDDKEKPPLSNMKDYATALGNKFLSKYGVNIKNQAPYSYWLAYMADLISDRLQKYGALEYGIDSFGIDQKGNLNCHNKIVAFHHCIKFLYTNACLATGVRYKIYADLNNLVKHNTISHVILQKETFEDNFEERAYSFFEIENHKHVFLGSGFLKDLLLVDFHALKGNLELKMNSDRLCALEKKWDIGRLIKVDKTNGFISNGGSRLHFFVDGVYFVKTEDSLLVDARASLYEVVRFLIDEINNSVGYLENNSF